MAQNATVDNDSMIEKIVQTHSVKGSCMSLEEYFKQLSPFIDDRFQKIEQLRPVGNETFHVIYKALLAHRAYLERQTKQYAKDVEVRQVHGDFNDSNVIMDKNGTCRVFVDWEFSHLGSPFLDISQMTNKGDKLSQVILNKYFSRSDVRYDQFLYDFFVNYFLFKIALNHLAYKDMAANRSPLREKIVSSKIRRILELHGFDSTIDIEKIVAF
jgi:aminoglycoside phosphotransferase (APT) family kinase protein